MSICYRPLRLAAMALLGPVAALATSLDEARALHRQGLLHQALAAYRAVAADPESDSAAAAARNNACVILLDLGDHRGAASECMEALRLRRAEGDEQRLGRTLNNLGLALQNLGRYDEAEESFSEALEINGRLDDAEGQAINRSNLAGLATRAGRYDRAMVHLDAALELANRHASEPWAAAQLQVAAVNRGVVLEKLGDFRGALDLYRTVLEADPGLAARQRAALLVNVGVIYRNLGDPAVALARFEEAAATYRELEDRSGLSNALLNIGLAHHLNLAAPARAEASYREALRLAEAAGDLPETIQDLFYLGRLLAEQRRLDEAEAVFRRCLDVAVEAGSAEGRWSALQGLGGVALAAGRPAQALPLLERAIGDIETVRSALPAAALRQGFFGDKRSVYATTVEVLAELASGRPDGERAALALEIAQRAKARDLLDALGAGGEPATPLTAPELVRRVGRDTLLEYFAGVSRLFVWEVGGGRLRLLDLGEAEPTLSLARAIHADLAAGREPSPAALRRLSAVLLADVEGVPAGGRTLWIAADGALRYLPFELLAAPDRPSSPLVERTAVAYLPSGSALAWLVRGQRRELGFLGVADPTLPAGGLQGFSARALASRFSLASLPGARRELASIALRIGGARSLLTGDEATEGAFRSAAAGGAGVLHLGAHAVVDEASERGTAILLAPDGEHDGLLYPDEIAGLSLPAGLSVLAACSTRLGAEDDGRALSSLTGSFLAAGSSGVVATLWDVGDEPTAVFMEQLYYHLGRGVRPAEALRRVKRTLRADARWSSPALWSGYVLVGRGEGPARRLAPRAGLAAAAVAAALALVWWIRRRRRRSPPRAALG